MKLTEEQLNIRALKLGIMMNFPHFTGEEKAKEAVKIVEKLEITIESLQRELVQLRTELETTRHIAAEQTEAAIDYQQENIRLQQENEELREKLEKCANEFGEVVWENAGEQRKNKEKDRVLKECLQTLKFIFAEADFESTKEAARIHKPIVKAMGAIDKVLGVDK
ncbi:MAG: hypothetical protein PHQ35_09550 [Phycisphaerae bacterium]|nr:hypothetical protein [Phycisphaerae bacterium]MDD5239960.1 hypothetical protein [Candidatus Nanoarchaeia archaeon]